MRVKSFVSLLKKDALIEMRSKETLVPLVAQSILISGIIGSGISSTFLSQQIIQRLFPVLLWLMFFLTAAIASIRSSESELEGRAFEGLLLSGVDASFMFLSKFIILWMLLMVGFSTSFLCLTIFLNISAAQLIAGCFEAAFFICGAYAALMSIMTGISATAKMKGIILPVILLPLSFPIILAAIELTHGIVSQHRMDFASPWFSVLLVAFTLYIILGVNLYGAVIKE